MQFPTPKQGTDHTVVLVEAFDIDTAWPVCDHVKQGRTVICNTERLSPDIRVRFQDIVSGSAYAIGGLLQAVSQFIFVFAPASTRIDFDDGRLAFSTLRDVGRGAHASNVTSERDLSRHTIKMSAIAGHGEQNQIGSNGVLIGLMSKASRNRQFHKGNLQRNTHQSK